MRLTIIFWRYSPFLAKFYFFWRSLTLFWFSVSKKTNFLQKVKFLQKKVVDEICVLFLKSYKTCIFPPYIIIVIQYFCFRNQELQKKGTKSAGRSTDPTRSVLAHIHDPLLPVPMLTRYPAHHLATSNFIALY